MQKKAHAGKHDREIEIVQPQPEDDRTSEKKDGGLEVGVTMLAGRPSVRKTVVEDQDVVAVEEEPVLPYSEREVARVLRFVPGAVTKARKRAGIGPEDAAYMPDARLSRTGVEKLLAELGIAIRTSQKKQGVDLGSLCEASEVKPGPVKHSIEVITCTVNRRLCTGVHCASGALVRLKVADNSLYLPGMEILARHVEGDLYEALETPRARGRI